MESQRGKIGTFLKWLEPYFFSTKVPKYLWGEAVLTAAHLINRMPSRVLNLKGPFDGQDMIEAGYDIKLDRDRI